MFEEGGGLIITGSLALASPGVDEKRLSNRLSNRLKLRQADSWYTLGSPAPPNR